MKRLLSILIAMFAVALCSLSCEDAGDYLMPDLSDGVVSEDAPEIKTTKSGYEQAQLEWTLNNEEGTTVATCYVYDGDNVYELEYDDCYDSSSKVWRANVPLSEGSHSLTVKSLDSNKTLSGASLATIVYAYGETYASELSHRLLSSSVYDTETSKYTLTFLEEDIPAIKSVEIEYPVIEGSTVYGSTDQYLGTNEIVTNSVTAQNETALVVELEGALNIDGSSTTQGSVRGQSIEIKTIYQLSDLVEGAMDDEVVLTTNRTLGDEITYLHVTSLKQLILNMSSDVKNHSITMTPGTYYVTTDNITDYVQSVSVTTTDDAVLLLVAGDYNYYDLSGVTIEIDPQCANNTGISSAEFHDLHITGRGNTIKGLTMINTGTVDDYPSNGYVNVVMDGAENVIEDVYTFTQGSYPYGYGELFGKGSPTVISHKKHSAWLIRGDYNTMRRCTVVHHAFGHFIFTQGGWSPTVEDCYVYGEMTNTDTILAEQGTGSAADAVDFMTYFGFFLTDIGKVGNNYAIGLGEGGVREYSSGNTVIDGVQWGTGASTDDEVESTDDSTSSSNYRDTSDTSNCLTGGNLTVRNVYLYQTRGNISFVLGGGTTNITNVTAIGNQGGFGLKSSSSSTGLRGTVDYGPVMSYAYGTRDGSQNKNVYSEVTVIPSTVETRVANNGSGNAIHMKCTGNEILLNADATYKYDDKPGLAHPIFGNQLVAAIGGLDNVIGQFDETLDEEAYNCTLTNNTEFPIQMSPHAHGCTVTQNGQNTTLIYGGTNANDVDCLEQATGTSYVGNTVYEGVKNTASANTVTVNGDGDVYVYGDGNTVTVNGAGNVYVLGNNNTISAPSSAQVMLASKITNHAYAKYPYESGTFPGYASASGYVGTLTFVPSGNTINGASQSGTAEEYEGGNDFQY